MAAVTPGPGPGPGAEGWGVNIGGFIAAHRGWPSGAAEPGTATRRSTGTRTASHAARSWKRPAWMS